ncbi:MAG: tRNA (adenosine(37)-N6)-dimethylallyltransferase MiaA [bacterium]|nr:tRNA (adenosine(37)-N6)-dimethylallyltransferase MiaA [bacterium]
MKKQKVQHHSKIPLVVILGPTSSGKSDLAIKLAKKFNGEIVSADSRQVYRGLDIGSGKVTKKEQKMVPHHLLDIAKPGAQCSIAKYKKLADRAILDIVKRGKVPFLVGGSPLYTKAVVEDYGIPEVKPDLKLRKELEAQSLPNLLKLLKKFDPASYERVDRKNPRRVIRALEIIFHTGVPIPEIKKESRYDALLLGIDVPREKLYEQIDDRVYSRVKQGMIREVEKLIESGVPKKWLKSLGLEYRFITEYLEGPKTKREKEAMLQLLKFAIHDFARRQLVWYRKMPAIKWGTSIKQAEGNIGKFLKR